VVPSIINDNTKNALFHYPYQALARLVIWAYSASFKSSTVQASLKLV
jgi:hypothetical protein